MKEVQGETQRQKLFRQVTGIGLIILGLYLFNEAYKTYKN
jgi:hypothetical protein